MKKTKKIFNPSVFSKTLLSVVITLSSVDAFSQNTQSDEKQIEEVTVTGVRRALEEALEVKRTSTAMVDHISSKDIGNLPALDLGEALQAIPGVQLSREGVDGERRSSSISLRGFTGGFVLQTANGQDFANPVRNLTADTAPSPFGAFEPGVFRGVTVYKSLQADLIEGAIAGVVDLKLPNALEQTEAGGAVSLGTRYEHLNDSYDPQFTLEGHTHLIEDRLAIYAIVSGSEQNFRRDSINIATYDVLTPATPRFQGGAAGLAQYRTTHGLQATDVLLSPGNFRQFTEVSGGDRISFTGNIGFKATDELTLSADLLYTKRDLDESSNEILNNAIGGDTRITPRGAPELAGFIRNSGTGAVEKTYVVTELDFVNSSYNTGNRGSELLEQTEGIFLNAEWTRGPVTLDTSIATSSARNKWNQAQFNLAYTPRPGLGDNGISGYLNTGGANYRDYDLTFNNPAFLFSLIDALPWAPPAPNSNGVSVGQTGTYPANNAGQVRFNIASGLQQLDRDQLSWDYSGLVDLDLPFLQSVKAGTRFASDEFESTFEDISVDGINVSALNSSIYSNPSYVGSTGFFNNRTRYLTREEGWLSIDVDRVTAGLQNGLTPSPGREILRGTGFVAKSPDGLGINNGQRNFSADLQTSAFFIMGNIQQEFTSDIELTGNFGVRYVETTQNASARTSRVVVDPNDPRKNRVENFVSAAPKNKYDHTLPSLNLSLTLPFDLITRFAAYRGLTRPNLQSFTPAVRYTFNTANDFVDIALPRSVIKPFTADSIDFALEWYNREGSGIALTLFEKKFNGLIQTREICPSDGGGFGLGTFTLTTGGVCTLNTPFVNPAELATPYSKVVISKTTNSKSIQTIRGLEFGVQQNLNFLPGFWSGFGAQASYTLLKNTGRDPIDGISEDSYNVITYWENETLSFRFAYNYRGEYTQKGTGSFTGSTSRFIDGRGQLDLAVKWNVIEDLSFTFNAYNMLDSIYEEYQGGAKNLTRRRNYDGRTYSLSANYNF